jgi:hypothetical protein
MKKALTSIILIALSVSSFCQTDYGIKFRVTAPNGHQDETVVRLNSAATSNFDGQWDAWKFFTWNDSVPSIYSNSADNIPLSISTNNFMIQDSSLNLRMRAPLVGGTYIMETEQLGAYPEDIKIAIKDVENGQVYNLCEDIQFAFEVITSTEDFDRFELYYSPKATLQTLEQMVSLTNMGSFDWDYSLYDFSLNFIEDGSSTNENHSIENLYAGDYMVTITDEMNLTDTLNFTILLDSNNATNVDSTTASQNALEDNSSQIDLSTFYTYKTPEGFYLSNRGKNLSSEIEIIIVDLKGVVHSQLLLKPYEMVEDYFLIKSDNNYLTLLSVAGQTKIFKLF